MTDGEPRGPQLGRKIRKSCDQCTNLKVKCPKEKPGCAKCLRRGISCTYSRTRRPGRASRIDAQQEAGSISPTLSKDRSDSVLAAQDSSLKWVNEPFDPDLGSSSIVTPSSTTLPDTILDMGGLFSVALPEQSPNYVATSSPWTEFGDIFEDFAGLQTLSMEQEQGMDQSNPVPPTYSDSICNGSATSTSHEILLECPSDLLPSSSVWGRKGHSLFEKPTRASDVSTTNTKCYNQQECLPIHNEMVAQINSKCQCSRRVPVLLSRMSADCQPLQSSAITGEDRRKKFETMIADLQACAKEVSRILDCDCLETDRYLCVLLALAVFRALGDYRAIAATVAPHLGDRGPNGALTRPSLFTSTEQNDEGWSSGLSKDDNFDRFALQMVLSNLHSVKRIIKRLAGLFKSEAENESPNNSTTVKFATPSPDLALLGLPPPVLQTIVSELQNCHQSLVLETFKQLRRKSDLSSDCAS